MRWITAHNYESNGKPKSAGESKFSLRPKKNCFPMYSADAFISRTSIAISQWRKSDRRCSTSRVFQMKTFFCRASFKSKPTIARSLRARGFFTRGIYTQWINQRLERHWAAREKRRLRHDVYRCSQSFFSEISRCSVFDLSLRCVQIFLISMFVCVSTELSEYFFCQYCIV